jgi:1-acyl-sn-glycerol-3-phosphate acyltransferase
VLYGALQRLTAGLLRAVYRLRVVGLQHVPRQGAAILAANHQSFLDPPVVGAAVPRHLHFLAKAELFRVPGLGSLIRRLNAHPVDRAGGDAAALRLAAGLLRRGEALVLFPEGTRSGTGSLGAGKAGVGLLALVSGAPVVPVYVRGTREAWPRGARWPRGSRITVAYGPPLRFAGGRGRARYQEVSDEIMAAIGRLGAAGDPGAAAVPGGEDRMDGSARRREPAGQIH